MPIGSAMVTAPRHVSPVRNPLRHRPSSPLNPLAARLHAAAHIHATTATAITTGVSTRTHLSNLDRLLQKKQPVAPPPPPQPAPDPVVEDDRGPRDSPFSFSALHRTGSSLLNALNLPSALFLPSSSTQQAEEISPRSLTHLRRLLSNSTRQSPRGTIAPRWRQYHGAADWDGLLDPLDHDLRRELIRYGEFAQATYHAFHSNPTAAPPDRPRAVVLPDRSYRVTRNLFATASVELPPWVDSVAPWMMTATPTSWVGYVAVCDNEGRYSGWGAATSSSRSAAPPPAWSGPRTSAPGSYQSTRRSRRTRRRKPRRGSTQRSPEGLCRRWNAGSAACTRRRGRTRRACRPWWRRRCGS
ncbi:unnamed protein product [Musa textilis]